MHRTHLQFINTIKEIFPKFIAVTDGDSYTFQPDCNSWLCELQTAGWNPLPRQSLKNYGQPYYWFLTIKKNSEENINQNKA